MPGCQQVRRGLLQFLPLVLEKIQRQAAIELRVITGRALEAGVLVVLDQVVVRNAGEGEGAEAERVDDRKAQQP